jgi:hypothetical protein
LHRVSFKFVISIEWLSNREGFGAENESKVIRI